MQRFQGRLNGLPLHTLLRDRRWRVWRPNPHGYEERQVLRNHAVYDLRVHRPSDLITEYYIKYVRTVTWIGRKVHRDIWVQHLIALTFSVFSWLWTLNTEIEKLGTGLELNTSVGSESESKVWLGSKSKARLGLRLTSIDTKDEKIRSMSMLMELRTLTMWASHPQKGPTMSAVPANV
ncbi:hypothetical protein EVAR_7034_1 [Eumeta japonica]|uniref:Uncharacterized protein n=1 Tax=Eumeta variegata TaxID=151549 RepID=A0A4C1YPS2_EUMVA|nr:hypothetical protein EVAR_7034_1 [Eumeta japonica]